MPSDDQAQVAALQDFIGIAAHELRNPLSGLVGAAETLSNGWDGLADNDRRQLVEILVRQSRRLSRLVDALLELSRLEAGPGQAAARTVDVAAEARQAADEAGMTDVAISCPPDVTLTADPDHLRRILVNLLVNADTHGGRPVVIEAERIGEHVEVRVVDAGPGVPLEFVPRLFDRFSRADTVTGRSRKPSGAGLGLAIVEGLARLDGGAVSYRPGRSGGAVFCVRLPAG